jgi:hypothetical protein
VETLSAEKPVMLVVTGYPAADAVVLWAGGRPILSQLADYLP